MTTAQCPVCGCESVDALLCHNDTSRLERELGDVAAIVAELDITLSRQARIGTSGKGGPAHERTPAHLGAMQVADDLANTLTTWARDVCPNGHPRFAATAVSTASTAAAGLLWNIDAIRKHPAVEELVDEITDAIARARRVVDRPANRTIIFVGPCPEVHDDGTACPGDVYAFIPIQDDKPSKMECQCTPADHCWSSMQWLRAGKRILDTIEKRKNRGAA